MSRKMTPVAVLGIGAVAIAALLYSRNGPEKRPVVEPAQRITGITVKTMTAVPSITAYGYVTPDRTWMAVVLVLDLIRLFPKHSDISPAQSFQGWQQRSRG